MSLLSDLPAIVDHVLASQPADWWAYHCDNGTQLLDRLACYWGTYEVQLNLLTHSVQAHCHACDMLSLILERGYGYYLQQRGAKQALPLFAAPGSLITMGPEDTHWIPPQTPPSLSLCIFTKQSDWHLWYGEHARLDTDAAEAIWTSAVWALRRMTAVGLPAVAAADPVR